MGATATPLDAARITPDGATPEARQTGGVTTRLILDYVEREGGRAAVEELRVVDALEDEAMRDLARG